MKVSTPSGDVEIVPGTITRLTIVHGDDVLDLTGADAQRAIASIRRVAPSGARPRISAREARVIAQLRVGPDTVAGISAQTGVGRAVVERVARETPGVVREGSGRSGDPFTFFLPS